MKTSTVKGTRDYLPKEAELRDFIQRQILKTYRNSGFNQIITPVLEDIDNLNNSDGGDNLSLIFKVLKRGEKLNAEIEKQQFDSLSDMGLRYDLTLPLCRYFASNKSKLILPASAFKSEMPIAPKIRKEGATVSLFSVILIFWGLNHIGQKWSLSPQQQLH